MNNVRVRWFGREVEKLAEEATDEALFGAAQELVKAAASRAPRRSGFLAESAYVSSKAKTTYRKQRGYNKERKPAGPGVVAAGFAAFTARYLEFGTRKMKAQPYLRPALDASRGALLERFGKEFRTKFR